MRQNDNMTINREGWCIGRKAINQKLKRGMGVEAKAKTGMIIMANTAICMNTMSDLESSGLANNIMIIVGKSSQLREE